MSQPTHASSFGYCKYDIPLKGEMTAPNLARRLNRKKIFKGIKSTDIRRILKPCAIYTTSAFSKPLPYFSYSELWRKRNQLRVRLNIRNKVKSYPHILLEKGFCVLLNTKTENKLAFFRANVYLPSKKLICVNGKKYSCDRYRVVTIRDTDLSAAEFMLSSPVLDKNGVPYPVIRNKTQRASELHVFKNLSSLQDVEEAILWLGQYESIAVDSYLTLQVRERVNLYVWQTFRNKLPSVESEKA